MAFVTIKQVWEWQLQCCKAAWQHYKDNEETGWFTEEIVSSKHEGKLIISNTKSPHGICGGTETVPEHEASFSIQSYVEKCQR